MTTAELDIAVLLTGQMVRLWPYAPGYFGGPDFLYTLWQRLRDDRAIDRVFWSHVPFEDSPQPTYEFFSGYMDKRALMLIVQDRTNGELAGMIWFDDIVLGHRASLNLWYPRRYWGAPAREATAMATRYAFKVHGWRHLFGLTPWKLAMRHGLALGWQAQTVPNYALVRDQVRDLYILSLAQGDV